MDAVKFLKERERMCDSFGECNCEGCEIYKLREKAVGRYTPSCNNIVRKLPEECIAIVEKWSAEHPRKTRLQDFLEKHPAATVRQNGLPPFMPTWFGYCGKSCYSCERQLTDKECWDLPLEE